MLLTWKARAGLTVLYTLDTSKSALAKSSTLMNPSSSGLQGLIVEDQAYEKLLLYLETESKLNSKVHFFKEVQLRCSFVKGTACLMIDRLNQDSRPVGSLYNIAMTLSLKLVKSLHIKGKPSPFEAMLITKLVCSDWVTLECLS